MASSQLSLLCHLAMISWICMDKHEATGHLGNLQPLESAREVGSWYSIPWEIYKVPGSIALIPGLVSVAVLGQQ